MNTTKTCFITPLIDRSSTFSFSTQNLNTTSKTFQTHQRKFSKRPKFMIKSTKLHKLSWMIRYLPTSNKLRKLRKRKPGWLKNSSNTVKVNFMIWAEDLEVVALRLLKMCLTQTKSIKNKISQKWSRIITCNISLFWTITSKSTSNFWLILTNKQSKYLLIRTANCWEVSAFFSKLGHQISQILPNKASWDHKEVEVTLLINRHRIILLSFFKTKIRT